MKPLYSHSCTYSLIPHAFPGAYCAPGTRLVPSTTETNQTPASVSRNSNAGFIQSHSANELLQAGGQTLEHRGGTTTHQTTPRSTYKKMRKGTNAHKEESLRAHGRAEGKPVLKLRQVGWEAGVDEAQRRLGGEGGKGAVLEQRESRCAEIRAHS